jgi:hypothetical protein
MQEDVGCADVTTRFIARGVTTTEVKWSGSTGEVKRRNKNDLMCHPTPDTMHPIHCGIQQLYPKWVPRLSWGLPKLRVRWQNH